MFVSEKKGFPFWAQGKFVIEIASTQLLLTRRFRRSWRKGVDVPAEYAASGDFGAIAVLTGNFAFSVQPRIIPAFSSIVLTSLPNGPLCCTGVQNLNGVPQPGVDPRFDAARHGYEMPTSVGSGVLVLAALVVGLGGDWKTTTVNELTVVRSEDVESCIRGLRQSTVFGGRCKWRRSGRTGEKEGGVAWMWVKCQEGIEIEADP